MSRTTRDKTIQFRVTAEEKAALQMRSSAEGLAMSDYVRVKALGDLASNSTPAAYAALNGRVEGMETTQNELLATVRRLESSINRNRFGR